jgi:hypothetical protein
MTSGRPTSIADKGPAAAPTTSTVSGAEQRAFVLSAGQTEATRLLFVAGEAVAAHLAAGKGTGPEYEALTRVWRQRQAEWRQAMLAEGVRT